VSLLTIATKALKEVGGFNVPSSFFTSGDPTAVQCVALANRAGRTLEQDCRGSELLTEHTFVTVADTATYAKPSDFRAFGEMSQWDRTNQWRLTGPTPSIVWQWLKSGISVASTANKWFMVRGAYITIYPTPSVSDETIAFDYYSKNWVTKASDSTNTDEWSADGDTARIDEDLILLSLKWRFLQAKGMPYEPEYREYENILSAMQDSNGGRNIINLGCPTPGPYDGQLPETGYGS
jgi:hypothetical protein